MPTSPPERPRFLGKLSAAVALLILPSALVLVAQEKPGAKPPATAKSATQPDTRSAAALARQKAEKLEHDREAKKQDDINRVMQFFKDTQPDLYEKAQTLRETDPANFDNLVRGAVRTVDRLEKLREKNPELFQLNMSDLKLKYESKRLAYQLKEPGLSAADREHATAEANKVVAQHFEVRQKLRQAQIDELKNQLNQLEARLQSDEKVKDTLIQKHIQKLMENPGADW